MKKTFIIISLVVIVVAVVIYFAIKANKNTDADFPLSYESRGDYVARLQRWLNSNKTDILDDLIIDGIFGPKTLAVLQNTLLVSEVDKELFNEKSM